MRKTIKIQCGPALRGILITALRNYTDVAFPEHSSDCAQVARNAMLEAVDQLEQQLTTQGEGGYNKRLRAMFKEGIKLHYQIAASEHGGQFDHEMELLTAICQGIAASDEDLEIARRADQQDH